MNVKLRYLSATLSALILIVICIALAANATAEQASQPSSPAAGQLDAGGEHTCAINAGRVFCWGLGFRGRLGYGNQNYIGDNESPGAAGPVNLGAGRTATAISTGDSHTCALLDSGSVICWGFGGDGRLGYGNMQDVGDNEVPGSVGPVPLGGPATAISAGGSHTCAILVGGSVRCWGYGLDGRLGYAARDPETLMSESIGDNETPGSIGPVQLGAPATAISAGGAHTCALLVGGSVRCWGSDGMLVNGGDGRLGIPGGAFIGDDETPSSHALLAVACPSATQCTAVDNAGQQVTFNPTAPGTRTRTTIYPDPVLTAVACPSTTQCTAVAGGGRQVTFNPTAPATPTPTTIANANAILTAVACPSTTQCTAVDNTGQQVTFDPTSPGTPTPTAIDVGHWLTAVACPSTTQCTAVGRDGRQVTFNPTAPGTPAPTAIDPDRTLTAVACPSTTQCTAVDDTGRQVTFNPTAPGTPTPTAIDAGRALSAVACPSTTQCTAVGRAGQQVTFNPAAPGTPTPTAIDAGHWLSAVACPSTTQCTAVGRAGQQVTFNPAAPGTPTTTTIDAAAPVDVGAGRTAAAISAGDFHTCAVLDGGDVRCWGNARNGRLGYANNQDIGNNETPGSVGPVQLGGVATAISAGNHTCARLADGTVRCWGPGAAGRLGYGNTNDVGDNEHPSSAGPVNLGAGRTAAAISAGGSHTCARLDDASVRCWGENASGQLGYGNLNDIGDNETPAAVGPVDFRPPGRPPGGDPGPRGSTNPPDPTASALEAQAARLRGLRSCLAKRKRHARRETRRARRLTGSRRTRARRHAKRHARQLRRACLKRWGRTPGRVTGLAARAVSRSEIVLTFKAAGTHGSRPPAAHSYLIKQSRRPIRSARAFRRAEALCGGTCRFPTITRVGGTLTLRVTDLRPRGSYYYSVAARDNVSKRLGPRSSALKARTR